MRAHLHSHNQYRALAGLTPKVQAYMVAHVQAEAMVGNVDMKDSHAFYDSLHDQEIQ